MGIIALRVFELMSVSWLWGKRVVAILSWIAEIK
jgi:hypothetical protein